MVNADPIVTKAVIKTQQEKITELMRELKKIKPQDEKIKGALHTLNHIQNLNTFLSKRLNS